MSKVIPNYTLDIKTTKKPYVYNIILPDGNVGSIYSDKINLSHKSFDIFRKKMFHKYMLSKKVNSSIKKSER